MTRMKPAAPSGDFRAHERFADARESRAAATASQDKCYRRHARQLMPHEVARVVDGAEEASPPLLCHYMAGRHQHAIAACDIAR